MPSFQISADITLKTLSASDAQTLFSLIDENRNHLRQWLPWLDKNTQIQDSINFIETVKKQCEEGLGFVCGIFCNQKLIDISGYHPIDKNNNTVVIGYWLEQNAQNF